MNWWVHELYQSGQTVKLVSWIFWVIFSITLHELAHGWAALWQGDQTPRLYKRMTLNPFVHMGPTSLLVFAVVGIAWGMMPVDPSRFRWKRKGRMVVAAAGPAMNVALGVVALTTAGLIGGLAPAESDLSRNVFTFFLVGGWLNLVLAVLNLLPVPPLDGSQILAGLSMRYYMWCHNPQAQMAGMIIVLVIFLSGIGSFVFFGVQIVSFAYVMLLGGCFSDVDHLLDWI